MKTGRVISNKYIKFVKCSPSSHIVIITNPVLIKGFAEDLNEVVICDENETTCVAPKSNLCIMVAEENAGGKQS